MEPGEQFDRYIVESVIGSGGMATVYRVRHSALGSHHALKVLHNVNPSVRERLVQEGRLQAQLRHANIVAVTDVITVEGAPGLVMELINGPSLEEWLLENRPDVQQAEAIFRGILRGVGHAHQQRLVHRDLKPGNVLLELSEEGIVPKVSDFGLAKILADDDGGIAATRSGTAMGTAAYMAPEQMRDAKTVDQRADIFALGCILYELVCGRSPFMAEDLLAVYAKLAAGWYEPPESIVPTLSPQLAAAMRAALHSRREDRASDCQSIRDLLDGKGVAAVISRAAQRPPPAPASLTRGATRLPAPAAPVAAPAITPAVAEPPSSAAPPVSPQVRRPAATVTSLSLPPAAKQGATGGTSPAVVVGGLVAASIAILAVLLVVAVGGRWWMGGRTNPPSNAASNAVSPAHNSLEDVVLKPSPPVVERAPEAAEAPAGGPKPAPPPSKSSPRPPANVHTNVGSAASTVAKPPAGAVPPDAEPVRTPAPAQPTMSTIKVLGDAVHVGFWKDGREYSGAALPAGSYAVRVEFEGSPPYVARTVVVEPGITATIECKSRMGVCSGLRQ